MPLFQKTMCLPAGQYNTLPHRNDLYNKTAANLSDLQGQFPKGNNTTIKLQLMQTFILDLTCKNGHSCPSPDLQVEVFIILNQLLSGWAV